MPKCSAWRPSCWSWACSKGDRVLIYMPMIAEAAFAMLACARIGAIHSVVFGGFASRSPGLAHRRCRAHGRSSVPTRARAAARSCPTSHLLDEAIHLSSHKPGAGAAGRP